MKSGEYAFSLYADDGCRLFIDDQRVIDHWDRDGGNEAHTGKITLTAGQQHRFRVEYFQAGGNDSIHLSWLAPAASRSAEVGFNAQGGLELVASQPGHYEVTRSSGKTLRANIDNVPVARDLSDSWDVRFPPKWGAPEKITLAHLISLSESTNPGVKYFSGTAAYARDFVWEPSAANGQQTTETWLDLGDVQVMAQVKLNGQDFGIRRFG
jgi:hypothetical protein